MGIIIQSGNHLLGLINDLLDLVRIDTNKNKVTYSDIDLRRLIVDTTATMHPQANAKQQALTELISLPNGDLVVHWDESKMRQVLINLIANAVKFTPHGGSITVTCCSTEGKQVEIKVIDNGIGIEDNMKEQVFLAFEQADNSYTRIYEGVGLGLAITRSIVSLHNGKVWIEDTAGGGTTVHMVLPINAETPKEKDDAENLGC